MPQKSNFETELSALKTVLEALGGLDEKGRLFVLKTAVDRLELDGFPVGKPNSTVEQGSASQPSTTIIGAGKEAPKSAKDFLRAKKPASDVQQVAVLAYYLARFGDVSEFKTQDIIDTNTDAGGSRISNPHRAVDNATRGAGFLIPVKDGKKKITALGEEIVEALPDQDEVRRLLAERKPAARRKAKKRAARKRSTK